VSDSRKLVYVSGAPGSGKTSLAVPLAAALGYALLAKDRIKETLHDAFGAPGPDRAWSRRLGGAAMELLWALAADAPAVVIEANLSQAGFGRLRCRSRAVFVCLFCVLDALPEQCLRKPGSYLNLLAAAIFRIKRLLHKRCAATCLRRRRPGQVRRRQGRLQITAWVRMTCVSPACRGQGGLLIVCGAMRLVLRGLRWASDRTSCSSMSTTSVSGS